MPDWQDYLTAAEREEIKSIPEKRKALTARYRQIYDRCRKRMGEAIRKCAVNGKGGEV